AGLERLDPAAGQWRQLLDGAFANVGELAQTARDYAAGIEDDPRRLEDVEQRRDVLFRLTQKYGPTLPDVLATRDRTARELDLLDTADLDLRQIAEQRAAAAAEFARACTALSRKRRRGAERLGHVVNELLPALGLAGVARGSAGSRQVLVITHLPQIAVCADHHLVVAKGATRGLATSDVQLVTGAARTRELARMLGDADMGTALRHAEELLRKASATSATRSGTPAPPASPRRSRR